MNRSEASDRSESSSGAASLELSGPAHAKVNLRLRVFERDETGYHSLESLYLRTSWQDTVTVTRAGSRLELRVEGPEPAPEGPGNLCWRAAEAFFRAVDFPPAARVHLEKRIPVGTGLGGGSADAAIVLTLLNELHGLPLDEVALLKLGGEIGSDVPFGVLGVPMALGWERGRRLLPLRPPPSNPALLVVPTERVRSADAYGWLAQARAITGMPEAGPGALPGPTRLSDWRTLQRIARNDFEPVVFERYPELAHVRDELEATEAMIARLTGSGSALFAVYRDIGARDAAVERLVLPDGWTTTVAEIPG
jgi:4-diphosphocytidyl-2-C-methyl-D-erythritol kinase